MKHIVCYSGGHSSALVALNVADRFGTENLILLNHDINPTVESQDIKRFKQEVADNLEISVTYANYPDWYKKDQFDVVIDAKAFKVGNGTALCTHRLKTQPFEKWLKDNFPEKDCIVYYGFDKNEKARIQRRSSILAVMGYKSDYPLALWKELAYTSTKDVGIEPPNTYNIFKHANCTGCLKAGKQHWYLVFLYRPDIWEKAKHAEDIIGYSIMKSNYLDELEEEFALMKSIGITTTEHEDGRTFAARVRKELKNISFDFDEKPCECVF